MKFTDTTVTEWDIGVDFCHCKAHILTASYGNYEHLDTSSKTFTLWLWTIAIAEINHSGGSTLVSAVTQNLLQRALQCNEKESESVDRVLLSLIVHCSKDEVHSRAMEVIGKAFTCTGLTEFLFSINYIRYSCMWNKYGAPKHLGCGMLIGVSIVRSIANVTNPWIS